MELMPHLPIRVSITLANGDSPITIKYQGPYSVGKVYSDGQLLNIEPWHIPGFIERCLERNYKISSKIYSIGPADAKYRYEIGQVGELRSDEEIPEASLNKLLQVLTDIELGDIIPYQSGIDADVTLDKLCKNKSNDYSGYERIANCILPHNVNTTNFAAAYPNMKPTLGLTIVVPAYNAEDSISLLLDSIERQSIDENYLKTVQCIIVDDNSKQDISEAIDASRYSFKIQIIKTNWQAYAGQARNLGYTAARHPLILSLDADVILQDNYLYNHLMLAHLYENVCTSSLRENIDRENAKALDQTKHTPNFEADSRYKATYGSNFLGGSGETVTVQPMKETNYFKEFGYGKQIRDGVDLYMMCKGHNYLCSAAALRRTGYNEKRFMGWGEEDTYLGRKLFALGSFVVPVVSASVFHIAHKPRLYTNEAAKLESLRKNVATRNQLIHMPLEEVV